MHIVLYYGCEDIMAEKGVNLNVRTSKALKEEVGAILHNLGLNHSIVVNMLYRQIALRRGIPFPVNIPNGGTRRAFQELEEGSTLETHRSDGLFDEPDT